MKQTGSALIVSLVLLLVLTVLSITAMQGTTMQERMAGNFRETNAAFQAAEAALRVGEQYLELATVGPFLSEVDSCAGAGAANNGLYEQIRVGDNDNPGYLAKNPGSTTFERWEDEQCAWIAVAVGNYEGRPPEYMIEQKPTYFGSTGSFAADEPPPESSYYRVTARGYSASSTNNPVVIVQSTYRRQ